MTDTAGTPFQRMLGLQWTLPSDDEGAVIVEMARRDDLRGPAGTLEGGVVSTLVDVAGASAAAKVTGRLVATQSIAVSLLAPGRLGPIQATGRTLRVGRQDAVSEVRVTDAGDELSLIAVALVKTRILQEL